MRDISASADSKRDPFADRATRTGAGVPCPYGLNHVQHLDYFITERCDEGAYETALSYGWRRSGGVFYRNRCADGCASCVPIRIDAHNLAPTKSQRHAIRANTDIKITLSSASFERTDFNLFKKYLEARHGQTAHSFDEEEYYQAYIHSPVETLLARYWTADGKLVAISYLDSLPLGLSSVYFIFDPDEGKRSLGVYSVFAEADMLRAMEKKWYYLGFWIHDCDKMSYKGNFKPFETASDGIWKRKKGTSPEGAR